MKSAVLVSAVFLLGVSAQTQAPATLADVLARVAAYLTTYANQYASTIATEHYTQTYGVPRNVRTLEAEFGIVRLPGRSPWLGFRDVTRVNGRAIPDRKGRLAQLFASPTASTLDQAARITEASTQFNVGVVTRTLNNPAMVLDLLDAQNQSSFAFVKVGEETSNGMRVWVLRGTERDSPTMITSLDGNDEPADLRAWVDSQTGRLLRAEVKVSSLTTDAVRGAPARLVATITVTFKEDKRLHIWVPATMSERYEGPSRQVASGDATYTNYRQFSVETHDDSAAPARK